MEQSERTREARAQHWRDVGGVETRPAAGEADESTLWPGGRSGYVAVSTPHTGIVATDGLSDPSGEGSATGLGVEVYAEGRELLEDPSGEGRWLSALVEEAAGAFAGAGASLAGALADHDLLSLELSGEHAAAEWLDEGRLGVLVGVELPGRPTTIDVDGGSVRMLALSPLRPSELAIVRAEGAAGRRRVAEALTAQGWYSYADSTRPAVL